MKDFSKSTNVKTKLNPTVKSELVQRQTAELVDNRDEKAHQLKFSELLNFKKSEDSIQRAGIDEEELQMISMEEEELQMKGIGEEETQLKSLSSPSADIHSNNSDETSVQEVKNNTGLPDQLKSGAENLSGYSMDDVKVHYSSNKPEQLNAHAYAQGTDIHLASGQEKHLPHEAWHVVQQKQGRVRPTRQMKGKVNINDEEGLEKEADVMGQNALNIGSGEKGNPTEQQGSFNSAVPQFILQREVDEKVEEQDTMPDLSEDKNASPNFNALPENQDTDRLPYDNLSNSNLLRSDKREDDFDYLDDVTEETANNGYALNPNLSPGDEKFMAKHGDEIVNNVSKGAPLTISLLGTVNTLYDASQPSVVGKDIFDKTQDVFKTAVENAKVPEISTLFGPVTSGISAVIGAMTKWELWDTYENAVFDKSSGDKKEKATAPQEAKYALTKVWKGFLRKVKDVIMAISNFVSNLLMLIPGAQIVAGPWKIFNKFVDFVEGVYGAGKGIYQFFKGEKKVTNAESLFNNAIGGDKNSLQLILDLKLGSIAGSGENKEEKWYSISSETKDKVDSGVAKVTNKVKGFLGLNKTKSGAERIIDKEGWGSGGPKTTEELQYRLQIASKNPDSKQVILSEIQETMTGYGK